MTFVLKGFKQSSLLPTIHPHLPPGVLLLSLCNMSAVDVGARGAVVGAEDLSIEEINAAFEASMLKVMDTNRVSDKVRRYLHELGATNLADAALLADEE